MRHASRGGFPAPQVYDADGPDILMERLDGPSLFQDAAATRAGSPITAHSSPTCSRSCRPYAPPAGSPRSASAATCSTWTCTPTTSCSPATAPRVIDWATAGRGASAADIAATWLALASGYVDPPLRRSRDLMLAAFLDRVDREAARPYLTVMAERRRTDRNADNAETAAIDRLLAREHTTLEEAVNGRPT